MTELEEMKGTTIGSHAPDFELPGIDGEVYHLGKYLEDYKAVAVIFMSNSCPFVSGYLERLKQMQVDFASERVILMGINSNDANQQPEDSFENMKIFAQEQQLNFPYIRDVTQDVAHAFGATTTPEAFLLNHEGVLVYRGLIDDNVDQPDAVEIVYLRQAISQLLKGEIISPSVTTATGCSLELRA